MTRKKRSIPLWTTAAICLLFFNSCLKDHCRHTYKLYKPVYKSLTEVRANMKSNAPQPIQQTGKLYIYGKYIFLNEPDKGIHIIDNTTPAEPKNIAFIDIPGNVDLAVKENVLYADSYSDLVSFDISNPTAVVAKNFQNNVFPERNQYYISRSSTNPDSAKVVSGWVYGDTTVDCETYRYLYNNYYSLASSDKSGSYSSPQMGGQGGSTARFTLIDDYLYTVTSTTLNTFNVSTPQQPSFVNKTVLSNTWNIETIFPLQDKLFIGSSNGLFIYNVSNPATPQKLGAFSHVTSCDPVIAEGNYAYVTLRGGTPCRGFTNQLEVLDISNLSNPTLLKVYPMSGPFGLAKDKNLLLICDIQDGLRVYDAADVNNISLLKTVEVKSPSDVIAGNNRALVVAQDGLYQFNYTDVNNIKLISKISLNKE